MENLFSYGMATRPSSAETRFICKFQYFERFGNHYISRPECIHLLPRIANDEPVNSVTPTVEAFKFRRIIFAFDVPGVQLVDHLIPEFSQIGLNFILILYTVVILRNHLRSLTNPSKLLLLELLVLIALS